MWWPWQKVTEWDLKRIQDRLDTVESRPIATDYSSQIKNANDLNAALLERISVLAGNVDEIAGAHDELQASFLNSHKELLFAVEEGIQRTERAERRIRTTIRSAQKKLADSGLADDAVDAEVAGLRLLDGEREPEGGVPPVREGVEDVTEQASSIKGVSLDTLRRARGL